jgi:radical SAM superfamily enzyme YgiQ (UPF0313 family)
MPHSRDFDAIILTDFSAGQPELHNRALGAYHIAQIMRERGLHVLVIDFLFSYTEAELSKITSRVISKQTKFIGISTTFINNNTLSLDRQTDVNPEDSLVSFIRKAKKINPQIKIIKGGSYSFYKDQHVDFYVTGQYVENEFLSLLNKEFNFNLPVNYEFTSHQFAFHELDFITPQEPLPLEVSRGCIFNCKFCGFYGRGKKKNESIKKFELIKSFLLHSYQKFGTEYFYLADDTFNESVEKMREFANLVKTLPFQPKFACYARLELFMQYPEMISLAKAIGIKAITFGIETFHPKATVAIGKSIQIEKIKTFLMEFKKSSPEIHTSSGFIAGLPHEDLESCRKTNDWLLETKVLNSWKFSPLYLDNLKANEYVSFFSKNIERYGYEREGMNSWKRPDLSFIEAAKFSYEVNAFNKKYMNVSAWHLFSGVPYHEIEKLKDLNSLEYDRLLNQKKFGIYKALLFNEMGIRV